MSRENKIVPDGTSSRWNRHVHASGLERITISGSTRESAVTAGHRSRTELQAVGEVLREMNRDNQMLDALKAVVVAADDDTRRLAAPFVHWIWQQAMSHRAIRIRRLVDETRGVQSLVKILRSRGRHKDADALRSSCRNAEDYVNGFLAHTLKSPKTTELNLTKLSRNTTEILRTFKPLYADEIGEEFELGEPMDRSWTEAFSKAWVSNPDDLWWNRRQA